jgi:glycogen debranching enzyme
MWTGWGVRTMSTDDEAYDPIGYHVGSVWPHDNALIADGLGRAGLWEPARRIAHGMIEAAEHKDANLPEVFGGYDRAETLFPVRYPTASEPQAWSTASTFMWIRSLLGLQATDGALRTADPEDGVDRLELTGVHFRGGRHDVGTV